MAGINHVSGNICSFKTELARPLVGMKCHFAPVQADGTPAPDNVLPITGWTDLNVIQSKKNLIPTDSPSNPEYNYKCTGDTHVIYDSTAGGYTESGTIGVAYFTHWYKLNGQTIPGNGYSKIFQTPTATTVTLSMEWKHNGVSTCGNTWPIRINKTLTGNSGSGLISNVRASEDPINWTKIEFVVNLAAGEAINILMYRGVWWRNLQVEVGSVATAYEDANCNVYPVTWSSQGTVYGGWCNPLTGVGEINWQYFTVDGSNSWTISSGGDSYEGILGTNRIISLAQSKQTKTTIRNPENTIGFCNKLGAVQAGTWSTPDNYIWKFCINNYNQLHIVFDNATVGITSDMTKEEKTTAIRAWLQSNPLTFALTTETPTSFEFTPISPITTLRDQNNIWCNTNGITEVDYLDRSGPMSTYRRNIIMNSPHDMEGSGWMAKFTTDMRAPLKSMRCYFNPVQAAGTPSPDNVLPISGHTGMDIPHTGKNLFDLNWMISQNGSITDGVLYDIMYRLYNDFATLVKPIPNTTYNDRLAISVTAKTDAAATAEGRGFTIVVVYDDGTKSNLIYFSNSITEYTTRTAVSAANKKVTALHVEYGSGGSNHWWIKDMMVVPGDTVVPYEPFVKTEHITFPSTLYGGWCDPMVGAGEIEWYSIEINHTHSMRAFTEDFRSQGLACNASYWLDSTFNAPRATGYTAYSVNGYCNKFPYMQNNYLMTSHASAVNSTVDIVLEGTRTQAEFLTWLEANGPIQVVYPVAEPIPFTFTPISHLKASRDKNNIWHSANGQTECRFWAHKGTDDSTLLTNSDGAYIVTSDGMYVLVG